MQQQHRLFKKGAEADIYYLASWHGKPAVSKVRVPKTYRHQILDLSIRRQRTIHEANFMSAAKSAGVLTPHVYFVDPDKAEIIMEHVTGQLARDILDSKICLEMGRYAALLHKANIVHGDMTTSNFIVGDDDDDGADNRTDISSKTKRIRLVLIDFGLSYYSERTEDMAVDIRLIKEVFSSAHILVKDAVSYFIRGYESVAGKEKTSRILDNVDEIERRGRYARVS